MILPRLRTETAALHERVERSVDLMSRLQSMESYADLLERYLGFYEPFEARLGHAVAGFDWFSRFKAPLLRRDLLALGRSHDEIERLPRCEHLPAPTTAGEAFGCLYVLEGATLGGQFIRKRIRLSFGLSPENGGAFFHGYGEETGAMWKAFCASLEEYASSRRESHDGILQGAVETFQAFDRWMKA